MSWLNFLQNHDNMTNLAELLNRSRVRDIVHAPFSIQALDTPPEDTRIVLVGEFSGQTAYGATIFDLSGGDALWLSVVRSMIRHIAKKSSCTTFITVGDKASFLLPPVMSDPHIYMRYPSSLVYLPDLVSLAKLGERCK